MNDLQLEQSKHQNWLRQVVRLQQQQQQFIQKRVLCQSNLKHIHDWKSSHQHQHQHQQHHHRHHFFLIRLTKLFTM
jgi:hypothetical protein